MYEVEDETKEEFLEADNQRKGKKRVRDENKWQRNEQKKRMAG